VRILAYSIEYVNNFFQDFSKNILEELKGPVITNSFEEKDFFNKADPAALAAGDQHTIYL